MSQENDLKLSRRDLLKTVAWAGASLGLSEPTIQEGLGTPAQDEKSLIEPKASHGSVIGMQFPAMDTIRMGFIGVGGRGTNLLENFLAIEQVRVTALCDIAREHVLRAQAMVEKVGQKTPATYDQGDKAFNYLCQRDDVDLVVIATPWRWHVPMVLTALSHGKHVAVEVPAATSLKECWDLVEASEKVRRHCVMLENCCYGEIEMMVLNMVRAGLFGELTHGSAAYNHDLRSTLFSQEREGLWRRFEHLNRNGNLYPTHGLGPVANYMNINRGDRFEYLVSMSSPAKSLAAYRSQHVSAEDPRTKEVYKCGDLNISLIKTAKGLVITLEHNVTTPQPYDRINLIAGTKGIFRDYPPRIYLDGQPEEHEFVGIDRYKAEYEHPLWRNEGELARKLGGHGGMDFIMCYRLIQCMHEGLVPDMDVYDAAVWSAPAPLSEMSVAKGSAPMSFPDFTRGRWKDARA
jgi:predicted dehydrogenase